ncbi:DNA translocase FtsK [Bryobacter aggregatus]|uniref:DNA translocase FtsK n=1 Tax=Bryobacter aggregatus TaxID=360054 RepID=UPI0004E0EA44|nr:DNA translocase FtsK [Bryobacter aggregatus]
MKLLGPTAHKRLNEALAFVFLFFGLAIMLSLISYSAYDPSWNTATSVVKPSNLVGRFGSHLSDVCFQIFGLSSFVIPALILLLAWKWMQSKPIEAAWVKVTGAVLFVLGACTSFSLAPGARAFSGSIQAGGLFGTILADLMVHYFNFTGAALLTAAVLVVSLYLISTFSVAILLQWWAIPQAIFRSIGAFFAKFKLPSFQFSLPKRKPAKAKSAKADADEVPSLLQRRRTAPRLTEDEGGEVPPWETQTVSASVPSFDSEDNEPQQMPRPSADDDYIPIKTLEDAPPPPPAPTPASSNVAVAPTRTRSREGVPNLYKLPPTGILNEPQARSIFDSQELRETASRIKERFEEFGVLGNVTQINPGPVVTTFEFKPEAGIKYSKITNLTEDLCLGLQAESILIERIPGKPTIGIEVPNRNSEVIALREVIEGEDFQGNSSRLTMSLGKDINGRIKIFTLDTMPHLLVAGSTGSGKSVMLNSMIMSVLYKSTPDEVRMIMIDPKRVELGIYEDIPHLLTPVITDPRKASNALRNAVLEMERRYKLLASRGVRNIDQFNRKMRQLANEPRNLFDEDANPEGMLEEDVRPLPYILIIIDELADLMMLERNNVETSVARLAQMARAVGMHLVLATQRPSVDVITGVIKANFPARISFRVATRVDSRTILDTMGAEHLLGKGDMLFLPPASSRLHRVHGAYVGEQEINSVVEFWKRQAKPEYDQTFLIAPPSEETEDSNDEDAPEGDADPLYGDAVKVICEMGKASTSILQRRLRLGYGRAARMLDRMQKEGIIGPPDGSRPREVLKTPDWLHRDMSLEAVEEED